MGGPENAARPMNPRIWLAGGGYMGRKANQVVRDMEAYIDLWSSRDGVTWTPVSYVEGTTPETLFSTSESFFVDSQRKYMGKWGHALIPFHVVEDLPAEITEPGGTKRREVRSSYARRNGVSTPHLKSWFAAPHRRRAFAFRRCTSLGATRPERDRWSERRSSPTTICSASERERKRPLILMGLRKLSTELG